MKTRLPGRILPLFLLLHIILSGRVMAGKITIGSLAGTDAHVYPVNKTYRFSASKILILQTELGTPGFVDSIFLLKTSGDTSVPITDLRLYMAETDTTKPFTGATSLADYTLVYEGDFPNDKESGWIGIRLDKAFSYSGTGHLSVIFVSGGAPHAGSPRYKSNPETRVLHYTYEDNIRPWTESSIFSTFSYRPVIRLGMVAPCAFAAGSERIKGPSEPICPGDSFTLATDIPVIAGMRYAWLSRTSGTMAAFALEDTLARLRTTAHKDKEYMVRVTCPDGSESVSEIFKVFTLQRPDLGIPSGTVSVCDNQRVELRVPFLSGCSYEWYRDSGTTAVATGNSYIPEATGHYYMKIYSASCPGYYSDTVSVVMKPAPRASTHPSGAIVLCDGNSMAIASPVGYSTSWLLNGTLITPSTGSTLTVSKKGSYQCVLTNSANGCRDTSAVLVVDTASSPTALVDVTAGISGCKGSPLELRTATTEPGVSYTWYKETIRIGSSSSLSIGETGRYTLVANRNSCLDTASEVLITFHEPPSVRIAGASGKHTLCTGDSLLLTALCISDVVPKWYLNDRMLPRATGMSLYTSFPGVYTVQVRDSNGCTGTSDSFEVKSPVAAAAISPTEVNICDGTSVKLSAAVPKGIVSSFWSHDGVVLSDTTYWINVAERGRYTLSTKDTNGCIAESLPAIINVRPAPAVPKISRSGVWLFTSISFSTYQWYRNNKLIPGATAHAYAMVADGSYFVTVSNKEACFATSDTIYIENLSVDDITRFERSAMAFPNPADTRLSINSNAYAAAVLTNVYGQKIRTCTLAEQGCYTGDLSPGVYTLSLFDREGKILTSELITIRH